MLAALGTGPDGLTPTEASRRRAEYGPNAVRTPHARALGVLGHQLRSALLVLLPVTAVVSYVLGERTEALIIGTILAASIGLGFANEYRAERAAEALHSSMRAPWGWANASPRPRVPGRAAPVLHAPAAGRRALTALDAALWAAPGAATAAVPAYRRLGVRPFDHDRRLTSSLVDGPDGPRVVVKGAPAADTSRSTWLGRSTRVARHQACRS